MIVRCLSFFGVTLAALMLPLWAVVLAMLLYLSRYRGLELIPLMLLIDATYGTLRTRPLLLMAAIGLVIAAALIKPRLRVYTQQV